MGKKVFIGICIGFSCLIVLFFVSFAYLNTDSVHRRIQKHINQAIPGTIVWEKGRFSLLGPTVLLEGVVVTGAAAERVATIKRFSADLSFFRLLLGDLAFKAVAVENPSAWLHVDDAGQFNIIDAFVEPAIDESNGSEGGLPLNMVVESLQLMDGFLLFERKDKGADEGKERITLHHLAIRVEDANLKTQTARLSVGIKKGDLDVAGRNISLRDVSVAGSLNGNGIEALTLKIASGNSALKGAGQINDLFSNPLFDLSLIGHMVLGEIRDVFPDFPELTGPLTLDLALKGPLDNPEVALKLDYGGGTIAGSPVDAMAFRCHLEDMNLGIEDMRIRSPLAVVTATGNANLQKAFPQGFLASEPNFDLIPYAFTLTQEGMALQNVLESGSEIRGNIQSHVMIKGRGFNPHKLSAGATLELSAKDVVVIPTLPPAQVQAKAKIALTSGRVNVEAFQARSGQTTFDMDGTYDVSSQKLGLTAQLASPDLGVGFFQPEGKHVRGALHVNALVKGSLDQPEVELRLGGQGLGFQDVTLGNVDVEAKLDPSGTLHLSTLRLENQGSVMEGQGFVKILEQNRRVQKNPTMDVNLLFRDVVLEHFIDSESFRGRADGSVTLTGEITRIKGNVVIEGKDLGYEDMALGNLTAHVGLEKGIISLDKVQLINADSQLSLAGTVQALDLESGEFLQNPDLNVTVKSEAIHLEDYVDDLTGTLSVKGRIRGPAKEPQGELTLRGHALQMGGQKIDTVLLTSRFDGGRVHVDPLVVKPVEAAQILVKGWISRDKDYALEMTTDGIDLSHVHRLQEVLPLEGTLSLDLKGEGSFKNPHVTGIAGFRNLHLEDKALQDLACNISLKDQEAKVSVDSDFGLEGTFHLNTKDFSLSARFEKTDLTPYMRLAKLEGIHGVLAGKADLAGNVAAPNTIQGEVDFSQFDLFSGTTPLVRASACQASFRDQQLLIPRVQVDLAETGHLTLEGKGKVDGPLDFKADGLIPMQIVKSFTDHVSETTGAVALSATVQGHSSQPRINVIGDLNNIGFLVPTMAQRVHNIQGKIRATTKAIVLEDCHGNLDAGQFAISGNIDLDQFQPSEVRLKAQVESLPVRLPNILDIMVDGKLDVQGTREASMVRGKVTMLEGTYYKDVELSLIEGNSPRRRKTLPAQQEITDPFLRNMAFDVVVTHRKPFLVDNNLALLTVKPDLRLYGTLNNPLMSGRAEVESGIITYQKEDFTVTQGVFDFVNPYRIEPTIDVKGEMKIRRWMIFLEVSGVPDNLKFILTSNPSETTEDLLSLLAFGKTTRELIGDESGSSFSTTQMLSDVLGGALGEELKDATGLDEVKIGYTEGDDDDEEEGIDVSLGKKLSRRTTVKYGVESKGAKTVQRVDVGYKLRQNLSVSSFQNTEGQFGGELLYRLEFR
jgi:autotransporter translocation and assembly factor TamB